MDAGEHDTTQDPGWRAAGRGLTWVNTPDSLREHRQGADDLLLLRMAFVAFAAAVVAVGLPVAILVLVVDLEITDLSTTAALAVVAALGIGSWGIVSRPLRLDCAADEALARSYRAQFFRRVASADASTVVGYVGAILTGDIAPYVVGAVCSLLALSRIAPTAAKLARDQQALTASGCPRSLIGALRRNANRPPEKGGRSGGGGGI